MQEERIQAIPPSQEAKRLFLPERVNLFKRIEPKLFPLSPEAKKVNPSFL